MSIRALALDLDGTLLRSDKSVSARSRAALVAARAAGLQIVLVTGRRYPAARRIATQLGFPAPLILHNGSLIVQGGRVVRCLPLARRAAALAVEVGRAYGVEPVVHKGHDGQGLLYVERMPPREPALAGYLRRAERDVRVAEDLLDALEDDPIQVMFGGAIPTMESLLAALGDALGWGVAGAAGAAPRARLERTVYPAHGVAIVDVLAAAAGKAEALAYVCRGLGCDLSEVLAIGDNWNDEEMLLAAGRGLVMANADAGLHRLGLDVLPSNDEDGVAVAIERLLASAPSYG